MRLDDDPWDRDDFERRRVGEGEYFLLTTILYRQRHAVFTTWDMRPDLTGEMAVYAYTSLYRMHDPDDDRLWDKVAGKVYPPPVSRGGLDEAHAWMVDRIRRGDAPGRW